MQPVVAGGAEITGGEPLERSVSKAQRAKIFMLNYSCQSSIKLDSKKDPISARGFIKC